MLLKEFCQCLGTIQGRISVTHQDRTRPIGQGLPGLHDRMSRSQLLPLPDNFYRCVILQKLFYFGPLMSHHYDDPVDAGRQVGLNDVGNHRLAPKFRGAPWPYLNASGVP